MIPDPARHYIGGDWIGEGALAASVNPANLERLGQFHLGSAALADAAAASARAAFFGTCDVVSLHLRLTSETRGSVTADDLGAMPPRSVLVNTSRAGLIAEGALLQALNAGHLGAAAVDVFDAEPLTDPNDPLLSHPKLIATPHIGFVTEDEFDKQFADIFEQVNAYAAGAPIHMINPSVYAP